MSNTYKFISSMNESYYNKCGHTMLESFSRFNTNHTLYLYNEDFSPEYNNVVLQGWNLGKEYEKFQSSWPSKSTVSKFSKKGFSIIHAMYNLECDYLIWIDADCNITKEFDQDFLNQVANKKTLSSHFSVWHNKNNKDYHSCETGFFVLNMQHPLFNEFRSTYRKIYVNQETDNLRRFYDGEVYGETVSRLDGKWMNNLNTGNHKTPMPRSIVKEYLTHYKGKTLKNKVFN